VVGRTVPQHNHLAIRNFGALDRVFGIGASEG
jgi:hypothetical protein